jgi:hypothetical protein
MRLVIRTLNQAILTQQRIHDEALQQAGSAQLAHVRIAFHDVAEAAMLAIRHLQNRLLAANRPLSRDPQE